MVSTYNEPLITSEWAVAIFKEAKAAGLVDRRKGRLKGRLTTRRGILWWIICV
jgi:hypothetical protein